MSWSRSNPKRATRLNFYMYVYGWICLLLTWTPLPLFLSPQDNHCLRVKLLGDCYYCVSQFESDNWKTRPDHAVCSVETGLHMIKAIKDVQLHTHVSIVWLLSFLSSVRLFTGPVCNNFPCLVDWWKSCISAKRDEAKIDLHSHLCCLSSVECWLNDGWRRCRRRYYVFAHCSSTPELFYWSWQRVAALIAGIWCPGISLSMLSFAFNWWP